MDAAAHYLAWVERYGDAYTTDEQRRAAYRQAKAALAELAEIFEQATLGPCP